MKIFALAMTAAAVLATPAFAQDIKVRVGVPGVAVTTGNDYHYRRHHEGCRTVIVKERVGDTVVVKKRSSC